MRRSFCILLALVTMIGGLSVIWPQMSAVTAAGRIPYVFVVDSINEDSNLGNFGDKLTVRRNVEVPFGGSLTMRGWFSTPAGVTGYEYICSPAGGGVGVWQAVPEVSIQARPDLTQAHVLYSTGHKSAGFSLSIPFPAEAAEGYYDVYLRAVTGDGSTVDFLALLHLRYGAPDLDDGSYRTISFERLAREGDAVLRGGATMSDDGIILPAGGAVSLGDLYLSGMESVTIGYTTEATTESGKRRAILGLKSDGAHAYGVLDEACNMTNDLAYAALPRASSGEMTIDLTAVSHSGDVWLSGWLAGAITITDIRFAYNGKGTDRVAAKLYLSGESTATYLSGQNAVSVYGINDPTVGDCLRVEVSQDTNDPYVYFTAGQMLEDDGLRLDADEYKYLVLLLRASPDNRANHMTLYLCAGTITGATEACTKTYNLERDGQWHYYLIDLTTTDNWTGAINGWRFDIISGNCVAGNFVDIATVQFFRTAEAARAAAAVKLAELTPYRNGEPAVIHDLCEGGEADTPYVVPVEDTVVDTAPDTEPPAESDTVTDEGTAEAETQPAESTGDGTTDTPTEVPTEAETEAPGKGCASVLVPSGGILLLLAVSLLRKRKNQD